VASKPEDRSASHADKPLLGVLGGERPEPEAPAGVGNDDRGRRRRVGRGDRPAGEEHTGEAEKR